MLEINNFSKFYGDKKVVDNLSISVQSGDIYGFIGANGSAAGGSGGGVPFVAARVFFGKTLQSGIRALRVGCGKLSMPGGPAHLHFVLGSGPFRRFGEEYIVVVDLYGFQPETLRDWGDHPGSGSPSPMFRAGGDGPGDAGLGLRPGPGWSPKMDEPVFRGPVADRKSVV